MNETSEALLRQVCAPSRAEAGSTEQAYAWTYKPWRQASLDPVALNELLQDDDVDGERKLWASVMLQAILDCVKGDEEEQRAAEEWMADASGETGSFAFIVRVLGCDVERARAHAEQWIREKRQLLASARVS